MNAGRKSSVFNAALALTGDARAEFLAEACGDDVALRREGRVAPGAGVGRGGGF